MLFSRQGALNELQHSIFFFVYNMFTKRKTCLSQSRRDKGLPDNLKQQRWSCAVIYFVCLHLSQKQFVFLANLSCYLELGFTHSPLVSPLGFGSSNLWRSVDASVKTKVHHVGVLCRINTPSCSCNTVT